MNNFFWFSSFLQLVLADVLVFTCKGFAILRCGGGLVFKRSFFTVFFSVSRGWFSQYVRLSIACRWVVFIFEFLLLFFRYWPDIVFYWLFTQFIVSCFLVCLLGFCELIFRDLVFCWSLLASLRERLSKIIRWISVYCLIYGFNSFSDFVGLLKRQSSGLSMWKGKRVFLYGAKVCSAVLFSVQEKVPFKRWMAELMWLSR